MICGEELGKEANETNRLSYEYVEQHFNADLCSMHLTQLCNANCPSCIDIEWKDGVRSALSPVYNEKCTEMKNMSVY